MFLEPMSKWRQVKTTLSTNQESPLHVSVVTMIDSLKKSACHIIKVSAVLIR